MRIPRFEAQTEWVKPTEFPDLRQVDGNCNRSRNKRSRI